MKVMIEVDTEDRQVIARWFGSDGKASADAVRRWAQKVIDAELEEMAHHDR